MAARREATRTSSQRVLLDSEYPRVSQPNFQSKAPRTRAFVPNAHQGELDHGDFTDVWAGNPPIQLHQPPPHTTTRGETEHRRFFPGPSPRKLRGSGLGLNQFRFKFWFSWSTRIFQNPARVSFTEPARARRQDEMQPVPVIPCREETTARVDVLRRQPHAGRWER